MAERDYANDWDNPDNPYGPNYNQDPQLPAVHPGANQGSGPWAPGYDPGPNWQGGQEPTPDSIWSIPDNNWTTPAAPAAAPAPAPAPSGGGGGGSVPPIQSSAPAPGGGVNVPGAGLPQNILDLFNQKPTQTPIQSAYQDALLKYMNRGFQTPSLDDSILGPQTEVFRAANQRNTERERRTAVERAGAGQSGSGYLDTMINEGVQKQGFNNAQFNSNLLGGEMDKRRNELQAALQLASTTGNQEAERELRGRLAQVQAAMQQAGLNLQGQLGKGDLDLRWALGSEGLNQNALQLIMGGL
jgi:hypothetical protein